MRGSRAKAMRRADPSRPNPGRKHGGYGKGEFFRKMKEEGQRRSMRGLKRLVKMRRRRDEKRGSQV